MFAILHNTKYVGQPYACAYDNEPSPGKRCHGARASSEIPETRAGACDPRPPTATQARGRTYGKNIEKIYVETV